MERFPKHGFITASILMAMITMLSISIHNVIIIVCHDKINDYISPFLSGSDDFWFSPSLNPYNMAFTAFGFICYITLISGFIHGHLGLIAIGQIWTLFMLINFVWLASSNLVDYISNVDKADKDWQLAIRFIILAWTMVTFAVFMYGRKQVHMEKSRSTRRFYPHGHLDVFHVPMPKPQGITRRNSFPKIDPNDVPSIDNGRMTPPPPYPY